MNYHPQQGEIINSAGDDVTLIWKTRHSRRGGIGGSCKVISEMVC
jgi:hypothetical protein